MTLINKPKVYNNFDRNHKPVKKSNVDVNRSSSMFRNFGSTAVGSAINFGVGVLGAEIGGRINEKFAIRSEQRADKRNRSLILDTPSLNVKGRLRAGLNPYGDPTMPGMSSASDVDTSSVASDAFYNAQRMSLEERIAVRQLENETLEATARARNLDADSAYKEDLLEHEMPLMEWLGKQAAASRDLSSAKYYDELADQAHLLAEWEKKSQEDRLSLIRSEKNRNDAIAKYNSATAFEKEMMNTQLDEWIELLPEQKRAELNTQLAQTESIENKDTRDSTGFWLKVGALVAGGVCMFIPGAQGLGVGLIASSTFANF